MVSSYFTLRALVKEWADSLVGRHILDLWTQQKGELTLLIEDWGQLHLRLRGPVSCMYRTPRAVRKRRDTTTVMAASRGQRIEHVAVAPGDRVLIFTLGNGEQLHVTFFGSRANAYLTRSTGTVIDAFLQNAQWQGRTVPRAQPASVPPTWEAFAAQWSAEGGTTSRALRRVVKLFDPRLAQEVMVRAKVDEQPARACTEEALQRLFAAAQEVLQRLNTPEPRLYEEGNVFALIPLQSMKSASCLRFESVDEGVRTYAKRALGRHALRSLRDPLVKRLQRESTRARRRVQALHQAQESESRATAYEHYGHLLMAAPPRPPGARSITLPDIMGDLSPVAIPLVDALSTIENAERYYERARSTRRAREELLPRIQAAESQAARLSEALSELDRLKSAKAVRDWMERQEDLPLGQAGSKQAGARLPYRSLTLAPGYELRIAKSARDGDALTFRHARPFDLWMHARGAPGAHVVLRLPNRDAEPGAGLIEKAASIAAHHSKQRGSALVSVIVTPRKYVRKPKRAPHGVVRVDREEVLMVVPQGPHE